MKGLKLFEYNYTINATEPEKLSYNNFVSMFANLCGLFSEAAFVGVDVQDIDTIGTVLDKMSEEMNKKFNIIPAIDFSKVAKNLASIKMKFSEDENEE